MLNDYAGAKLGREQAIEKDQTEKEHGGMSAKTVRDICTILKSIIRYGEKEYQMSGLVGNIVLPKVTAKSKDVLKGAELKKIEKISQGESEYAPLRRHSSLSLYRNPSGRGLRAEMGKH